MARRILIVDDEPEVVELLSEALEAAGFRADGAGDGTAALALVKEKLYDVVILDFALPDTNGLALHSRIRQIDPELAGRALFVSGEPQSDASLDYYAAEGTEFFRKPFDLAEVVAAVRTLIDRTAAAQGS
jgi:two-component system OmpR family response regulator